MENDIFSLDENGNLIMTTWVDYEFAENEDAYDEIAAYIDELSIISGFERVHQGEGIFSDWDNYAKKGLYAYDNYDGETPTLISKPITPIIVDNIPSDIVKLLKLF